MVSDLLRSGNCENTERLTLRRLMGAENATKWYHNDAELYLLQASCSLFLQISGSKEEKDLKGSRDHNSAIFFGVFSFVCLKNNNVICFEKF